VGVTSDLHPPDPHLQPRDPLAGVRRPADPTDSVRTDPDPGPDPDLADDMVMDPRVLHERLAHIAAHVERLADLREPAHQPAWLRRTAEEPRLPVIIAIAVAISLQAFVPHSLSFRPWWLLPALETLLGASIILFRQTKVDRRATFLRVLSLALAVAAGLATAWSAAHLIDALIHNHAADSQLSHAGPLLRVGGGIWLTNVIVFALWYWDLDRGGPVARACGERTHTDFLFAQMTAPELVSKDWEPRFVDYLYLSFTNSTAFSPTDTLPLSRWAKMTMMFQSALSLGTVALVVARAVNVL
jgi:hypothetical protein